MEASQNGQTPLPRQQESSLSQAPNLETDDFSELKRKGLNVSGLVRILRRNILVIAGISTAVAMAMAYQVLKEPRSYEGGFRILVEPISSEAKLTDPVSIAREGGGNMAVGGVDYPTLLQILRGPGLLSQVVQQVKPKYPDVTEDRLAMFLLVQRLGTTSIDSTRVIEVRYADADPAKVEAILQATARVYLKYSLEDRKTRIGGGVSFIESQLPRLRERVDELQAQIEEFLQSYRLTDPNSEGGALAERARELQSDWLKTQQDLAEQRQLYTTLQQRLGFSPAEAVAASSISQNPRYQALLTQLQQIESQIAVKSARFSDESPVITSLREQKANLLQLLDQEAQNILGQQAAKGSQVKAFQDPLRLELIRQLVTAANQIQTLEVRSQVLNRSKQVLDRNVQQYPQLIRQYTDLQNKLDIATKTLNQLLIQRETLRVEAAQKEVPWEIVSEPKLARDPYGRPIPAPRNKKKLMAGTVGGVILGLFAALLLERWRNRFYVTEDVQDAVELPLLGVLPYEKAIRTEDGVLSSYSGGEPPFLPLQPSLFSEAFNSLYASLRFLSPNATVRSLAISSAVPGEGKTTVALNLAKSVAFIGQRVLLVDANLRSPDLHNLLGIASEKGLADLLVHGLEPESVIQASPLNPNLFILPAGTLTPDSARLLAADQMQALMAHLHQSFDLVIYDTAHLLNLADAHYLADHTDGVVFVVAVGKTKRTAVMQALEGLNAFKLPVIGFVANHLSPRTTCTYGYQHRYFRPKLQRGFAVSLELESLKSGLKKIAEKARYQA